MKDLGELMKQAQEMQEKLQAAQARLAENEMEGTSGGGLVKVTLKGGGRMTRLSIDPSLLTPGEADMLADLVIAAHGEARRKLEEAQTQMMREIAGPFA